MSVGLGGGKNLREQATYLDRITLRLGGGEGKKKQPGRSQTPHKKNRRRHKLYTKRKKFTQHSTIKERKGEKGGR